MVSVKPCESNYCTFTLQGSLFWFPCPELYNILLILVNLASQQWGAVFLLFFFVNALANTALHIQFIPHRYERECQPDIFAWIRRFDRNLHDNCWLYAQNSRFPAEHVNVFSTKLYVWSMFVSPHHPLWKSCDWLLHPLSLRKNRRILESEIYHTGWVCKGMHLVSELY